MEVEEEVVDEDLAEIAEVSVEEEVVVEEVFEVMIKAHLNGS